VGAVHGGEVGGGNGDRAVPTDAGEVSSGVQADRLAPPRRGR